MNKIFRRIADFVLGYRHGQWDRGTFCYKTFPLGNCTVVRWQAEYRGRFYGDFITLTDSASDKHIQAAKHILRENSETARAALALQP